MRRTPCYYLHILRSSRMCPEVSSSWCLLPWNLQRLYVTATSVQRARMVAGCTHRNYMLCYHRQDQRDNMKRGGQDISKSIIVTITQTSRTCLRRPTQSVRFEWPCCSAWRVALLVGIVNDINDINLGASAIVLPQQTWSNKLIIPCEEAQSRPLTLSWTSGGESFGENKTKLSLNRTTQAQMKASDQTPTLHSQGAASPRSNLRPFGERAQ